MIQGFDSDSLPDTGPAHTDVPKNPADRWWLLPALLVLGFALLIWQVKTNGPVTTLDIRIRDRLQVWAKSWTWTYRPGRGMADLGNESITLPVLLLATALAARTARSWRPILITVGAFAILGTVILLKLWINRPGPGTATLGNANLGFFPSGHTADAVLCYGTSALLLRTYVLPNTPSATHARRIRQAVTAAATVLVLATILGLLWSNFHWLSDTLGALCWCGAALAFLFRTLAGEPGVRRHGRARRVSQGVSVMRKTGS